MVKYTREERRELEREIGQMNERIRDYLKVRHRLAVARRNAARLRRARAAVPPCPICGFHGGFHDQSSNGPHSEARANIPQELKR